MASSLKHAPNPLGIVALFVSLMEAMATVSLKLTLDAGSEYVGHLVWFLVFFPVIIFLVFFRILWAKREILYGPRDFQKDESFLRLIDKVEILEIKQRAKDVDPRMLGAKDAAVGVIPELLQIGEIGTAFHLALAFVKVNRHKEAVFLFEILRSLSSTESFERLVSSAGDQYSGFFASLNSSYNSQEGQGGD